MDCFIADLRGERARSGVSLEEIVRVTKVPQRHLMALEEGRFDDLPGGIFRKGILRSYLQVIGADAAPWMLRFEGVLAELDAAAVAAAESARVADSVAREQTPGIAVSTSWSSVVFATMLLLLVFGWCVWRFALRGHTVLSVVTPVSVRHGGAVRGPLPAGTRRR